MGWRELVQMAKLFATVYESHLGIVMSFRPITASHKVLPSIRNVGHSSLSQLNETVCFSLIHLSRHLYKV